MRIKSNTSSLLSLFIVLKGLLHDGHLVDEVCGTGEFVDDEEAVADVEADVAAVVGVEEEVAHGAFPAAVEVDAYELSVGIEHRAAAVAAGGVVGGNEAHGHLTIGVGVAAVVAVVVKLLELGLHHVVVDVGVLFLHDALEGAVGFVIDGVLGLEALHMAVGHTEGEIGIGEEVAVGVLLHHAADVGAHETVDLAAGEVVGDFVVAVVAVGVGYVEEVCGGVGIAEDFHPVFGFVFLEELVVLRLVVEH